jgi:hypothetical protein
VVFQHTPEFKFLCCNGIIIHTSSLRELATEGVRVVVSPVPPVPCSCHPEGTIPCHPERKRKRRIPPRERYSVPSSSRERATEGVRHTQRVILSGNESEGSKTLPPCHFERSATQSRNLATLVAFSKHSDLICHSEGAFRRPKNPTGLYTYCKKTN